MTLEIYLISGVVLSYKLLAFDQSTSKTGWAFFDGEKLAEYGVINKTKIKDTPNRIKEMYLEIIQQIDELHPDKVIIEAVQQQASPATSMMLSQLQGMIIGYLYEHHIAVDSPLPTQWRKRLGFQQGQGIKRDDLKVQSISYVKDTYGIETESDDVADAICIGAAMCE